jgi:hypothetical protein
MTILLFKFCFLLAITYAAQMFVITSIDDLRTAKRSLRYKREIPHFDFQVAEARKTLMWVIIRLTAWVIITAILFWDLVIKFNHMLNIND